MTPPRVTAAIRESIDLAVVAYLDNATPEELAALQNTADAVVDNDGVVECYGFWRLEDGSLDVDTTWCVYATPEVSQ